MENLKNTLSNILAIILIVASIAGEILDAIPEGAEWYTWLITGAVVVIAYLTGKKTNLKK